jgi:hypothetical protein
MKNFHSARFFFLVFIHIATILVSSLCLKIENLVAGKHNFIPSIPQLLKGVSNCDVRILWDGLQVICKLFFISLLKLHNAITPF